jgi:hypothetical protein
MGVVALLAALLMMVGAASAAGLNVCVPEKEGAAIVTPVKGVCKATYTATALLPKAEQEKLQVIMPYEKYVASGVGGKPTIQISGANLQILSGAGSTNNLLNGGGNLIIGYDETPGEQTGSHNLIVGTEQSYTSSGSILGGRRNSAANEGTVLFGQNNTANGGNSSVTGGEGNKADGSYATVSGGVNNIAGGFGDSVSGGSGNLTTNYYSSISGGQANQSEGEGSSVSGGVANYAGIPPKSTQFASPDASVSGGQGNKSEGRASSILGGHNHTVTTEWGLFP